MTYKPEEIKGLIANASKAPWKIRAAAPTLARQLLELMGERVDMVRLVRLMGGPTKPPDGMALQLAREIYDRLPEEVYLASKDQPHD